MSKSLKNFPDPMLVVDRYGSDALRLYLIDSPVVRGEPLRFVELGVKQIVSGVLLPLWNSYNFFAQQIALFKKNTAEDFVFDPEFQKTNHNIMDRWILAATQSLIQFTNQEMEGYRLYTVVPRLLKMIDEMTNWYIRFNRDRLKGQSSSSGGKPTANGVQENGAANGDEEEGSPEGMRSLIAWCQERGQLPDVALIGEASNEGYLGQGMRVGRRGSLNVYVTVHGVQGHVAYPERAKNPIHSLVSFLGAVQAHLWAPATDVVENLR